MEPDLSKRESRRTLDRLIPRLKNEFSAAIFVDPTGWQEITTRLDKHFPNLFRLYMELYGDRYDFFFHMEDLLTSLVRSWLTRPADLRELDRVREADRLWFQSNRTLGGVCYVDRFRHRHVENVELFI